MSQTDSSQALHYSEGKSGVDQIPVDVLLEWGDVFSYGEKKYARDNWKKGSGWHEFYGSALRHLLAFWAGEDYDDCDGGEGCTPEEDFCPKHSRLSHLTQAIWNSGALRYFQLRGLGTDDRDKHVVCDCEAQGCIAFMHRSDACSARCGCSCVGPHHQKEDS